MQSVIGDRTFFVAEKLAYRTIIKGCEVCSPLKNYWVCLEL